jgi:hypothetical protein
LDGRMMAWLMELSPRWGFELGGQWVLGYRERPLPSRIEEMLTTVETLLDRVPSVVSSLYPPLEAATPRRPDPA